MLIYNPADGTTIRFTRQESEQVLGTEIKWGDLELDDVCEVAHLELTSRCNLKCEYCYQKTQKYQDLSTSKWKKVIDTLNLHGIHQITFGGGEPLLRDDIFELADYCNAFNIPVCITTNGLLVEKYGRKDFKKFRQVNVSYHGVDIEEPISQLSYYDVPRAINYLVIEEYLSAFDDLVHYAKKYDATLLFLSCKGRTDIPARKVEELAVRAHQDSRIRVAIDTMTANRCYAKERFVTIGSDGEVYPCSFVRKSMGNITKLSFDEIWRNRGKKEKCPYA